MMRMTAMMIFILMSIELLAPESKTAVIIASEPIKPYKTIIRAIGSVECLFDTLAINPIEQAYGYFQCRQIRLDDYYKQTGIRYSLNDMLDYEKAERVFLHYASQFNPTDIKGICVNWNGVSKKNLYYQKVKKAML